MTAHKQPGSPDQSGSFDPAMQPDTTIDFDLDWWLLEGASEEELDLFFQDQQPQEDQSPPDEYYFPVDSPLFLQSPEYLSAIFPPDDDEEQLKLQRKRRRIAECGRYVKRPTASAGGHVHFVTIPQYCHYWRECPTCLNRRALEIRNRFNAAKVKADQEGSKLKLVVMTAKEAERFSRKNAKEDYMRLPVDENQALILTITNEVIANTEQLITGEWLTDMQRKDRFDYWLTIANTPEGLNASGKLGAELVDGKQTMIDPVVMECKAVSVDPLEVKAAKLEALRWQAEEECKGLPTNTPEEMQAALDELSDRLVNYLVDSGVQRGKIHVSTMKKRVDFAPAVVSPINVGFSLKSQGGNREKTTLDGLIDREVTWIAPE